MIPPAPGTRKVPSEAGVHFEAGPPDDPQAVGSAAPQPPATDTHPEHGTKIADWLRRYFVAPGQAVELRVLRKDGVVEAGFFGFDQLDALADLGLRRSEDAGVKGVYFTLNPLRPEVLERSRPVNTLRQAHRGESASKADVARRSWLLIDADPCRPTNASATDGEKAGARARVLQVRDHLTGRGWPPPLVADSGNGHHLLYRVDLPVDDGGLLKRVLLALARRFSDGSVTIDRTVHDAPRITKLYGSLARKGDGMPERPHRWTAITEAPETVGAVPREMLDALAAESTGQAPLCDTDGGHGGPKLHLPMANRQARARAYVARMPAAVEGQGGDKQTFTVACVLVKKFALTEEEAFPILEEYNRRCVPPWPEEKLRYKLEKAREGSEGCARLAHAGGPESSPGPGPDPDAPPHESAEHAAAADAFLGTVPDFILADWCKIRPKPPRRDDQGQLRHGRRYIFLGIRWLLHREVVRQKQAMVYLPDVLLAQTIWGSRRNCPSNWRSRVCRWVLRLVRSVRQNPDLQEKDLVRTQQCHPSCPLYGRAGMRHGHFVVTVGPVFRQVNACQSELDLDRSFLGVLELFRCGPGGAAFDFSRAQGDDAEAAARQKEIDGHRKAGRLYSVYLPALLFGPSPRSGLTPRERNILVALTRETTRSKLSNRDDKARVLVGGQPDSKGAKGIAACPYLEKGGRYVAFNGNGRRSRRGRGYQLIGNTGKGWLSRAGFSFDDNAAAWGAVRGFLMTLGKLSVPFGLVAAGWHRGEKRWRPLEEMINLTRTPAGRAWLNGCSLRVYGPEDYAARWRRYFADRLGLSDIPGGGDESPPPAVETSPDIGSAADFDVWKARAGLTDRQVAEALGLSESYVSRQRAGRRRWSKAFEAQVMAAIADGRLPRG
jgi:hypothetical protein